MAKQILFSLRVYASSIHTIHRNWEIYRFILRLDQIFQNLTHRHGLAINLTLDVRNKEVYPGHPWPHISPPSTDQPTNHWLSCCTTPLWLADCLVTEGLLFTLAPEQQLQWQWSALIHAVVESPVFGFKEQLMRPEKSAWRYGRGFYHFALAGC